MMSNQSTNSGIVSLRSVVSSGVLSISEVMAIAGYIGVGFKGMARQINQFVKGTIMLIKRVIF